MNTRVDLRFLEEARAAGFCFRCDDCVNFDAARTACAHEYPVAPHRPGALRAGDFVVFCKEFELGGPSS